MTDHLRDPIEMMEAETRLILADFFRRGVSKEKWEDAPSLAARKVRAALAAAPQPATPGERMIRASEEAVAIARGEAEPASVYPATEYDWGEPVGKEVLPPYRPDAPQPIERRALVEIMRKARQGRSKGTPRLEVIADALLARGLRLPGGDETMAWAVVGRDGKVLPFTCCVDKPEICTVSAERVVRVAIRVVEGGDNAA